MVKSDDGRPDRKPSTRLVRVGRDEALTGPFVNPPVVHASTVLFPDTDTMLSRRQRYLYGRRGTPTSEALETAISDIEGASGTVICPSGLNAVSTALLSALSAGDEVLIVDCVYGPVRHFADTVLKRMGIDTVYFDPAIGTGIADIISERTAAVYLEAPGSLTFEMQDVPAIAGIAHDRGATVLFDNTWATPFFFKPLAAGVDLSIQAGTKYLGGHSDVNLGLVAANERHWPALKEAHGTMGLCAGPDDIYLGLRGLRTMGVRLERQMQSALTVAGWLQDRPEVARVLHPALPDDPGHALWKRDMGGACGLFSIILDGWSLDDTKSLVDGLDLFGIGASWGGFESLAILADPRKQRTAVPWAAEGPLVRLHIGLEDPGDLIADLKAGFDRIAAA
ncbi:cystathionine beta-lyase [Bauldia litoralis]|uniref:Cystathionine beta-lyase n=1 Tax=Bauldia litoralis TaxID=665467 RepID=A0A1G6B2M1_9HYPH|nr:cystathionine beta-lyase [Bauldia litoralis]SDB14894.1 cystathionine beta-lyase [Bauldia litoralis]